jgi:hypothetical protein
MPDYETRLEIGELTREDGGPSMWQARVVFMPFATEQEAINFLDRISDRMEEWDEVTIVRVQGEQRH